MLFQTDASPNKRRHQPAFKQFLMPVKSFS